MKFETVTTATFTITALTGNGTGQAVTSFIKSACGKYKLDHEIRACPLPEGADPALATWEVVVRNEDEKYLASFVRDLRSALDLLPIEQSVEEA